MPGTRWQLPHHAGRGQPAADTVADDDADPAVRQFGDVVPVATDLQRRGGGLIADREPRRQPATPEQGVLQGQRDLTLLIEQVHPVQRLIQATAEQREQGPVFQAERRASVQLDPQRGHVPGVLDGGAGPSPLASGRR